MNSSNPSVFGIVAGSGVYPRLMARAARRHGVEKIVVAAFENETDPQIAALADEIIWMRVGQLGKLCKSFSSRGVRECVMAGAIALKNLFDLRPDFRCLKTLATLKERNAATLFGAVVSELEKDGIKVVEASRFLESLLPPPGLIAGPKPGKRELADIAYGVQIAKQISALNIGQSVVVRHGTVLAVEAYESTSDVILRGGKAGKEKAVLIKASKPNHDFRFDIPVIGIKTLDVAREAKLKVIAVEAGKTMLLELEDLKIFADRHQITLYAFDPEKILS